MKISLLHTLSLVISITAMPNMFAMEALEKTTLNQTAIALTTTAVNVSLKMRSADILAEQLIASLVNVKNAEKNWAPDLVELVKARLIHHNLLFFAHLFKPLAHDILEKIEKNCGGVVLSPNNQYALVMGDSYCNTPMLFDTSQSKPVPLPGHQGGLTGAVFSKDSRYIITGSLDSTARIWDVAKPESSIVLQDHNARVEAVAFSPDGRFALTGSQDHTARLWDLTRPPLEGTVLLNHKRAVQAVAFSNDGKYALTGAGDCARLWNIENRPGLCAELDHQEEQILSVAFSRDDQYILTGTAQGSIRLWHRTAIEQACELMKKNGILTPEEEAKLERTALKILLQRSGTKLVVSLAFSQDGRYALAVVDFFILLWDLQSFTYIKIKPSLGGCAWTATFDSDGKSFLISQLLGNVSRYSLYDIPEKLSLELIVLLIQARLKKALSQALTDSIKSLSPEMQTVLQMHNYQEPFELQGLNKKS